MSEPFEQLVIARLDDLKNDINTASARHEEGMKKLFDIHEEHAKDDIKRFEGINDQFTSIATKAAEAKGEAKQTAKMWGFMTALPVPIGALLWKIWLHFHGLK